MTTPANIETIRGTVAEEKAIVVQHSQSPRGYKTVLIRKWIDVEDELRGPCVAFLRDYGTAANKEPSKTVASGQIGLLGFDTVTDPQASLYAREGLWLVGPVAEVRNPEGKIDIVQTLFRGTTGPYLTQEVEESCEFVVERTLYLNSSIRPTTPATRPAGVTYRISEIMVDPETGAFTGWLDTRTRQYQELGPFTSTEDTFVKTDTFIQDGVTSEPIDDPHAAADGTILRQNQQLNGDCSKKVDTDTLTAKAAADAQLKREITLFETRNTDLDRNQTDPATLPTVQTPGEITEVASTKNEFRRYDIQTTVRAATTVEDAVTSDRKEKYEASTQVVDRNMVSPASAPGSQTPGQIVTVKDEQNDFKRHDITTETRVSVAVTDAEKVSQIDAFETRSAALDRNQVNPASIPVSQADGQIVQVKDTTNEFARHDVETVTRVATAVTDAETSGRVEKYETVAVAMDRNQTDAATIPATQTPGAIITVKNEKNEFKRYDVTEETRTANPVTDAQKSDEKQAFETVVKAVDRNQTGPATIPSVQVAGTIVTIEDDINEFARHDIKTVTRTAVGVDNAEQSKTITAFESVHKAVDRNDDTPPSLPASQTPGIIVTLAKRENEFQRTDVETVTRTAVERTAAETSSRREKYQTVSESADKNLTAAASEPVSQSPGQIVTVKNALNDFQRYDAVTETAVAVAVSDAEKTSEIRAFESAEKVLDRNQVDPATPPVSQDPGTIVVVKDEINAFARHDIETHTRTATPVSNAEQRKVIEAFESKVIAVDRNQTAAGTLPASQTPGTIIEVKTELNEFQRHDVQTETRAATAVTNAAQEKTIGQFETVAKATDRNQSAAGTLPSAQTVGTLVTVNTRENEFARHDVETVTRTAVPVGDTVREKTISGSSTSLSVAARNAAAAETEETVIAPGTVKTTRSEKNEFKLFDNTVTTRTATKQDTDWRTFTDVDGDKSYREFQNITAAELTAIEASITGDYKGALRAKKNEFDLYDGYATREPSTITLGGFDTGHDFDYELTTEDGTFHVYVLLTSNRTNAATFMSDSPANNADHVGVATCGITYIGKGIYKATKIVKS